MPWEGEEYQSGSSWLYEDLLGSSIFTLCPAGDFWETYRTWEAIEAGSIPIVHDVRGCYAGCTDPAVHLRTLVPDGVLLVDDWAELPALLAREMSNLSKVSWRQNILIDWLATYKRQAFVDLTRTVLEMRTPRKAMPPTACTIRPLAAQRIAQQQTNLARYWRRPQHHVIIDEASAGLYMVPRPFVGKSNSFCGAGPHDTFTEKCFSKDCMPLLIHGFKCYPKTP